MILLLNNICLGLRLHKGCFKFLSRNYIGAKSDLNCIYRKYLIFNNVIRTDFYVVAKVRLYFDFCLRYSQIHKIFDIHVMLF